MSQPMQPRRGGTPKIVPVLVSIGVAAGTFSGLYFGLGTSKDDAVAEPSTPGSGSAPTPDVAAGSAEPSGGSDVAAGSGSGSDVAAGSGSGSDVAAGSGSGSDVAAGSGSGAGSAVGSGAGSAQPAVVPATLTFSVTPADATITVDGAFVTGGTIGIQLKDGKKTVRIVAKAAGYRSYDKKMTIEGDSALNIKLVKRSGGGHSGGSSGGAHGPGDKIDI